MTYRDTPEAIVADAEMVAKAAAAELTRQRLMGTETVTMQGTFDRALDTLTAAMQQLDPKNFQHDVRRRRARQKMRAVRARAKKAGAVAKKAAPAPVETEPVVTTRVVRR